jgi:hypothetical protein
MDKMTVENEFGGPVVSVLLQNAFVNGWCYLNLSRNRRWKAALAKHLL